MRQTSFSSQYRSTDISNIKGQEFDLVVCAGAPAAKWVANREPQPDWANLENLIENLRHVRTERFLLISTIDVYSTPIGVTEETLVDPDGIDPYGRHRYLLEDFVRNQFPGASVVRLPGLFGIGLKKNFIYDLLHSNALDWTHKDSEFQFYDMERLWIDASAVLDRGLPLVNFATGPVKAKDLALRSFDIVFDNIPDKAPVVYDMWTNHAALFGGDGHYIYDAEECFDRVKKFVASERGL